MNALVYTSRAGAIAAQARIEEGLGYPKPGVNVGGGIHVPPEVGRTLHHVAVTAHPDGTRWALPVDEASVDALDASAAAKGDAEDGKGDVPEALDATWTPAAP